MSFGRRVALVASASGLGIAAALLAGHVRVALAAAIVAAATSSAVCVRELVGCVEHRAPRTPDPSAARLPAQLRQIVKALNAARVSEFGVDRELRPLVQPIAAARLARRGIDLERDREAACAVVGAELWELVRPDRDRGSNQRRGGMSRTQVRALIDRLEAT